MSYIYTISDICACGREKVCVLSEPGTEVWECILCDRPQEINPYINVCWNCKCSIDSRVCHKSMSLGMGYHCNCCGKDLTEWKQKMELLAA